MARRLISGRLSFKVIANTSITCCWRVAGRNAMWPWCFYAVCAAFGLLATIFTKTSSPATGFALFVIAVAVIDFFFFILRHALIDSWLSANDEETITGDGITKSANPVAAKKSCEDIVASSPKAAQTHRAPGPQALRQRRASNM